ncbi:MAG TPA: zinc ribbon domain-containing protein [Chloroflexi bacterium]|nr:zinc ribbon domain-containing protein [Chloroflexota bacterium]
MLYSKQTSGAGTRQESGATDRSPYTPRLGHAQIRQLAKEAPTMCCGGHSHTRHTAHQETHDPKPGTQVAEIAQSCPNCGSPVEADFILCPRCGTPLKRSCPSCHRAVNVDWAICPYCGSTLEESA